MVHERASRLETVGHPGDVGPDHAAVGQVAGDVRVQHGVHEVLRGGFAIAGEAQLPRIDRRQRARELRGVEPGLLARAERRLPAGVTRLGRLADVLREALDAPAEAAVRPAAGHDLEHRPRRAAPEQGGDHSEPLRKPVGDVTVVSREALVPSLAGERDLDLAARESREDEHRDRRGVRERLVVGLRDRGQELGHVLPHQEHRVLGLEVTRDGARRGQLVVGVRVEADRERLDRPAAEPAHARDHRARVDAAAQERAHRNVGDHPVAHRLLDARAQLGRQILDLGGRARFVLGQVRELPVAVEVDAAVAAQEEVRRRQLRDASEDAERRRDVPEGEIVVDCDRIHVAPRIGILQQPLELRCEGQALFTGAVVERFHSQSVAGEEQGAAPLVPDREREHPAQCVEAVGAA